jgi:RNA recognition motif-containing protein
MKSLFEYPATTGILLKTDGISRTRMDALDLSRDNVIKATPKIAGKLRAKGNFKGGRLTPSYAPGDANPGWVDGPGGGRAQGTLVYGPADVAGQSCRVYVGNLDWSIGWQEVKDIMHLAGDVVSADVLYEPSGRSKGYAIVQFASPEAAQCAIGTLQGVQIGSRPIFVREDRLALDVAAGGAQPGRRSAAPYGPAAPHGTGNCRVYVGNLDWSIGWQEVKDVMRSAGDVVSADVLCDPSGRSKGCAIVQFASPEAAQCAIDTLQNVQIGSRPIFVREDRKAADVGAQPGDRSAAPRATSSARVLVGNLAWSVTAADLEPIMRSAGEVLSVDVLYKPGGRSKGCALVSFANEAGAYKAIATLQDLEVCGRPIWLREDRGRV